MLENVKNLKSHDKGKTFKVIMETLDELGYEVADAAEMGKNDPKIIDGKHFLPQHRERIVLVGFRRDLNIHKGFTLRDISRFYPEHRPSFGELLEPVVDSKYILTPKLWEYLYNYAKKHAAKGNGFGFGLVNPENKESIARTLSARYHKDGSEILIDRGWDMATGEADFMNESNQARRPRRLTPRECARLMGFENLEGNHSVFRFQILSHIGSSVTQLWCQYLKLLPDFWNPISSKLFLLMLVRLGSLKNISRPFKPGVSL